MPWRDSKPLHIHDRLFTDDANTSSRKMTAWLLVLPTAIDACSGASYPFSPVINVETVN